MRTGIIYGMSNQDYHSGPEISNTAISAACRSMAHYQQYKTHGSDIGAKTALDGHLIHCAILEPDQFPARYIVAPKFDMRTTIGKSGAAAFEEVSNGRERITQDQLDMAMTSAENVRRSGFFMDYMNGGTPEVSIFWADEESGLDCRCRPDWMNGDTIVDVKTIQDAKAFEKSVLKYGYARQASFYLEGCKAAGLKIKRFLFLVVEKLSPNAFMVYELAADLVEAGYQQWRQALNDIAMAQFTGVYGGYSGEIRTVEKPIWMG